MNSNLLNVLKDINKSAGENVIGLGSLQKSYDKVPFSSPRANYMTYGGIPLYHITEFCGPENSGKTTSAINIIGNYQKREDAKNVVYIDVEHRFDAVWATKLGAQPDKMIIYQPMGEPAETVLENIRQLLMTDDVGFMVLDSIATLVPKAADENDIEHKEMCGVSQIMTKFVNLIVPLLRKYQCTFIGINQVRENLKSAYDPYVTPGGKAWKHQCILRIMFRKGKFIDKDGKELTMNPENPAGNIIQMTQLKNTCSRPDRHLSFYTINYTTGIRELEDTVETALQFNLINKHGAWYSLYDFDSGELMDVKLQGLDNVVKYLKENPEYYKKFWDRVNSEVCAE